MSDWDDEDDEDWDDDDADWEEGFEGDEGEERYDPVETGSCPECKKQIHVEVEACPYCGHWLTVAERHRLWDGKGGDLKSLGKFLLIALLIAMMTAYLFL